MKEKIKKIGDDIILVEVILPPAPKPEKPKKAVFLREDIQIPDISPIDYADGEVKPRKKYGEL